jgi:dTDP-glucose 4,6-dehydratase
MLRRLLVICAGLQCGCRIPGLLPWLYNTCRPHRTLNQAAARPLPDGIADLDQFRVQRRDHVGALFMNIVWWHRFRHAQVLECHAWLCAGWLATSLALGAWSAPRRSSDRAASRLDGWHRERRSCMTDFVSRRVFQRAVVTGGAGFLGSHLCERLLALGTQVVCLDNFLTGIPANITHLIQDSSFRLARCDVTDFINVPGEVDLVLHFASPASPADYLRLPIHTLKVGSQGTLNALGLAREKRARFVLASTSEVYGDPLQHPQCETYWGNVNPVGPRGVYDEAKRYAEALTTAYRTSHNVDTAIVRIFNTYGPRMRPDDGRAIPTFIHQALTGQPLTVTGDGSQTRSVCYVDDTVRGILDLAVCAYPGPVNIGNPDEASVLELAQTIRALTGSDVPVRLIDRPTDDPRVRRPDTALAESLLGWKPQTPREEGLQKTINWFRGQLTGCGRLPISSGVMQKAA